MAARPWTPAFASAPAAQRRLAAALVVSVLAHALFAALAPGSAGHGGSVSLPTPLAARLIAEEPRLPGVEPAPERAIVSPPTPRPERRRAPAARPAQASAVAAVGQGGGLDLPDATYYGVRQLDVFPALAAALELKYPPRAAAGGVKGRVTLLVLLDAHGVVNEVSVVDAEPAGYFEEDALRALRSTRFKPAEKDGRPVKSRLVIEINYGDG